MNKRAQWKRVKFGDAVKLNKDLVADPVAEGIERYVGIEHIEPEDLRIRSWGLVAEGTTFTNFFQPGQVLFVKRRAYQRKVAVADFSGVCSGDIYVLESKDPRILLPELLPFICQTDGFFNHAVGTSAGSLSPRTNWKQLANYEFALPPLEEQRRIANLLQALINAQDRYEDAVYFSRLVVESMLNHLIDSVVSDKTITEINIEDLGFEGEQVLKTGPFGSKLRTSYFRDSGIPIISIGSLKDNSLDEGEFFYLDPIYGQEFQDYKTEHGDIVFSRVADVGRCHLITESDAGSIISSNLVRIRVNPTIIRPSYLWLLLKYSIDMRRQIARITTQAAGRLLVNTKTMQKLNFCVPALDQQDTVISRFEEAKTANSMLIQRACMNKEFFQRSLENSLSGLNDV